MPRVMKVMVVLALVAFACSAVALMLVAKSGRGTAVGRKGSDGVAMHEWTPESGADPLKPDDSALGLSLPPFELVTQDGTTISRASLVGQLTIVDFIFTHCPFICPMMTERMSELSQSLRGINVRFLSISVDPTRDTPARLLEFAQLQGADTTRWTFATGDVPTLAAIVEGGLRFALDEDAKNPIMLPDGSTMNNIVHPGWFVLIGPDARPLGVYGSSDPERLTLLAARARAAAERLK